jgi:predicted nucleic acid-binding Zn ribbon protein
MRYCLYCGNRTYNGHFYCSKTCKIKMKKLRRKQPKYYYDDEAGKWEQLN